MAKGTRVHTGEYASYARLPAWGYRHVTVCHAHGEYARDEDGDGFCEIQRQHPGGDVVLAALLAPSAPGHLAELHPVSLDIDLSDRRPA